MNTSTGQPIQERNFPMPKQVLSPEIAVWSPSGNEVAVEDAVGPAERVLWVVSSEGARIQKILSYASETYGGIDWSPDGRTLYYSGLEDGTMKIFAIARTGGPSRESVRAQEIILIRGFHRTGDGLHAPKSRRCKIYGVAHCGSCRQSTPFGNLDNRARSSSAAYSIPT